MNVSEWALLLGLRCGANRWPGLTPRRFLPRLGEAEREGGRARDHDQEFCRGLV